MSRARSLPWCGLALVATVLVPRVARATYRECVISAGQLISCGEPFTGTARVARGTWRRGPALPGSSFFLDCAFSTGVSGICTQVLSGAGVAYSDGGWRTCVIEAGTLRAFSCGFWFSGVLVLDRP